MTELNPNLIPPAQKELEESLQSRVKGQPEAIGVIAEKYALFKSGIRNFDEQEKKKPIGVFLFLGHSRVGKTEIGRALAQHFHGTMQAATIIDCVSYQDKGEVNKLLGASPGYIGYEDKPRLSQEKLYAVIPGYEIKPETKSHKQERPEKKDEIEEEEVDAAFGFESWINQLHLIDQGLKNIDRKFAALRKSGLSAEKLEKMKARLKARRKAYSLHREHILLSYEEIFLQSLESWAASQKRSAATADKPPEKIKVEDESGPARMTPINVRLAAKKEDPILVIIFDEIEKAHLSLREFLLHVMEEGEVSLGNGEKVDLSRAFIILTSNIGSETASKASQGVSGIGFTSGMVKGGLEKRIRSELKKRFAPEFLNRLDAIIVFNLLSPQDFRNILELKINELELYLQKFTVQLKVEEPVKIFILKEAAKKPDEQAKSLTDCFKKYLAQPIGNLLITGQLTNKKRLHVSLNASGKVIFET